MADVTDTAMTCLALFGKDYCIDAETARRWALRNWYWIAVAAIIVLASIAYGYGRRR